MIDKLVGTGLARQASPIRQAMANAPAHWPWVRLKYLVQINAEVLSESTSADYAFRYIDIGSVTLGRVNSSTSMTFSEAPSRARRVVHEGDIIVSTVRTYLKAIARIDEDDTNLVCSTGFAVIRAGRRIDRDFLYLWLISRSFVEEIVARSTGVGYPAVTATEIGDIACPLPPLDEQRAVVERSRSELARVQIAREALAREAALLDERADALVTSSFAASETVA